MPSILKDSIAAITMIAVIMAVPAARAQDGGVLPEPPLFDEPRVTEPQPFGAPELPPEQEEEQAEEPAAPVEEDLDSLFARLQRVSDPGEGRRIANDIWAEWGDSGSATINLLMQWAAQAIEEDRQATALDLLDQVTVLKPDFAEGFNRRATLHYMMGNHRKSMADINRVLELEPRHFGALSGMAAIMMEAGNDRLALRALERVLEIYPSDRAAQGRRGGLQDKLSGERV